MNVSRPLFVLCALALLVPVQLVAQDGTGTLTIEQRSSNNMMGMWTLIKPGNKRVNLDNRTFTLNELPVGQYTLLVDPPSGAVTSILKYFESDLIETLDTPQISFSLEEGMAITLRLDYTFTRVGIVSVSSDPAGLSYTIVGPNDFEVDGTTPNAYEDMPEGQYSVRFHEIEDCAAPPPLSDKLIKDSRINFNINIECEGLEDTQQQQDENLTFEFVNTVIDGETVIFQDVRQSEWFAPYVHTVLRIGVMSGYKDSNGKLSGEYGPGNNVTLAELLKIAHELAGIHASGRSLNSVARGTWFEKYQSSAEKLHWLVYQDSRIDFGRPATRAEVIVTLVQALEIPRLWATGTVFTDIERSTPYSSSIETAAIDGMVSGYEDNSFRPDAPINRAEIAKIIAQAIDLYLD